GIAAVQVGEEQQHLAHAQMRIEASGGRYQSYAAFHLVGLPVRAEAGDRRPAGGRQQQSQKHAQGGRLAGAVGPEQPVDFPGLDANRHRIDGQHLAAAGQVKASRQSLDLDHSVCCRGWGMGRSPAGRVSANVLLRPAPASAKMGVWEVVTGALPLYCLGLFRRASVLACSCTSEDACATEKPAARQDNDYLRWYFARKAAKSAALGNLPSRWPSLVPFNLSSSIGVFRSGWKTTYIGRERLLKVRSCSFRFRSA